MCWNFITLSFLSYFSSFLFCFLILSWDLPEHWDDVASLLVLPTRQLSLERRRTINNPRNIFILPLGVASRTWLTGECSQRGFLSWLSEWVEFELKMSFTLRSVKVPPNSANLEEARSRVFEFFKTACRSLPSIMDMYNLDDVASKSQLRSVISSEIRKNSHVTNPKVLPFFFWNPYFIQIKKLYVINPFLYD